MPSAPKVYSHRTLILCEGPEDVAFFRALKSQRNLPHVHIDHTGEERWSAGGNGKFGKKLSSLKMNRTFRSIIDRVLIFTDSDEDQTAAFENVRAQLEAIGYPCPAAPFTTALGQKRVCVATIPFQGPGNLECFLWEAAASQRMDIAAHVDHFADQVAIGDDWTPPKKGKLKSRALFAARWPRDPCLNIAPMLKDALAQTVIPVTHNSFNQIADFVTAFANAD